MKAALFNSYWSTFTDSTIRMSREFICIQAERKEAGRWNILSASQVITMLCKVYEYTLGTVYILT